MFLPTCLKHHRKMFTDVFRLGCYFEVRRVVVLSITITVVYYLTGLKSSSEHLLGNYTVLMPSILLDI